MYDPKMMRRKRIWDDIIISARKICIWDPSFSSERDHEFFQSIKTEGVEIEILTMNPNGCRLNPKKLKQSAEELMENINRVLIDNDLEKFSVTIRCLDLFDIDSKRTGVYSWHDRYLITDKGVFIMGTSMSSQVIGNKLYGIHRLEHREDEEVILHYFNEYRTLSENKEFGFVIRGGED